MDIKDRLLEFIKYMNLNNSKFEKAAGLSNGYLNNSKGNIGAEKLEDILKAYPMLNRFWLLLGEGEMLDKATHYTIGSNESKASDNGFSYSAVSVQDNNYARIAESNSKIANAVETISRSNEKLVDSNAKLIERLINSIDRIEKKIDDK